MANQKDVVLSRGNSREKSFTRPEFGRRPTILESYEESDNSRSIRGSD